MKFSLIVATKDRYEQLDQLLKSLIAQRYGDFELIIVDQNQDDRLLPLVQQYQHEICIIHTYSEVGLSRARNKGTEVSKGDIVAFPDDDCFYPPDILSHVHEFMTRYTRCDGVLGRRLWNERYIQVNAPTDHPVTVDKFNATTSANCKKLVKALFASHNPSPVNSSTMFLRRGSLTAVDGFDETLGLGAGTLWGGGEDVDLIVRMLKCKFTVYFANHLVVYHPKPDFTDFQKGYQFGTGMGKVLEKNEYPAWFKLYHLLRSLSMVPYGIVHGRWRQARYYWAVFRGKWAGWRS
ncbi:MAG: glycosyltransferase family 2 protein [Salinibacter sp.]